MDRARLEEEIRTAFQGVVLGQGVSHGQARVLDRTGDGCSADQLSLLIPPHEVKDDWSTVPLEEIENDCCLGHLDAEGLRYYLPALMLGVLDRYDPRSEWVIATLMSLDPGSAYREMRFNMLNEAQRRAVAHFLDSLPRLESLHRRDEEDTARSLDAYWRRFLVST